MKFQFEDELALGPYRYKLNMILVFFFFATFSFLIPLAEFDDFLEIALTILQ